MCLIAEMLECSVSAAKHNFAILRDVVERYAGVAVWISPPAVRCTPDGPRRTD